MSATPEEVTGEIVGTVSESDAKPANLTGGSRKGIPNKNTAVMRDLARHLAEERSDQFLVWIDQMAAKRPDRAVNAYLKLLQMLAPRATGGFQLEAATQTTPLGQTTIGLRLRALLEAPENA